MNDELKYLIALSQVKDIGPVNASVLLEHFGDAEQIFKAKGSEFNKISGIGIVRGAAIKKFNDWQLVERELKFIEKEKITCLSIKDPDYPNLLKNCVDAPVIMYLKGKVDLNNTKVISIIGRRLCSDYGRRILDTFIEELAQYNVLIISGLAIGIDHYAHKIAVQQQLPTVGVLAHGLHTIYPSQHSALAKEMQLNGGILSEFISGTKPDKENFPIRNRIVAGMSEATIVIETDVKGGSMITANLANGYNRDVMAFPGNINSVTSAGCNHLIKTNKAHLITEAKDLVELLNWEPKKKVKKVQRELFVTLTEIEQKILHLLQTNGKMHTDALRLACNITPSQFAASTINLEMQGIISMLPAKIYTLVD